MESQPFEASLSDIYGTQDLSGPDIEAILDASLHPRGPGLLFDMAADLGIGRDQRVLDVGSGDARRMVELSRRLGSRVTGVEPTPGNLDRGRAEIAAATDVAGRVEQVRGRAEALPFPDGMFDLVWCRDMLIHVAPLREALGEALRVTRRGGHMLVFTMFATPRLEPAEATRLWSALAAVPENTDPAHVERSIEQAGWSIERREELQGEWREWMEESGDRRTSRQLLRVARLLRDPDRYRAALGRADYEVELADCLWGVYQMIGKLSPRVYLLARN